eukprot:GFKZ01012229.1.p1 GENE.GFKZ01012229.1~~GFKZ01012229.1.p1  ORF type:complete len:327 (+),score=11.73 GFKZ01012229.1:700-1680(+)
MKRRLRRPTAAFRAAFPSLARQNDSYTGQATSPHKQTPPTTSVESRESPPPPASVESRKDEFMASPPSPGNCQHSLQGILPNLQRNGSNFELWNLALMDIVYVNDRSYMIPENDNPPPHDPYYKKYRIDYGLLRMHIINSLPNGFESKIDIKIDTKPRQLINNITKVFKSSNSTDQNLLRQEAAVTTLTSDMSVENYIDKHRVLRTRLKLAGVPNISQDESITVQTIIEGIQKNPDYSPNIDSWANNGTNPTSIQEIEIRLRKVQSRLKAKLAHPTPDPQGATLPRRQSLQPDSYPRTRASGRKRGRRPRGYRNWGNPNCPTWPTL